MPLFVRDSSKGVRSNTVNDNFLAVCCSDDCCGKMEYYGLQACFVDVAWLCSPVLVYQRDIMDSTVLVEERIGLHEFCMIVLEMQ